jgi:hypothetical protein
LVLGSASVSGIYEDIPGAPFRIGQRVRVAAITDETADVELLGNEGIVTYFEYDCGCGQTFPEDPMIGVLFGSKIEEFWKEELTDANLKGSSPHSTPARQLTGIVKQI